MRSDCGWRLLLLADDAFCLFFDSELYNNEVKWYARPLFTTRVKFENDEYSSFDKNEIEVNTDVLRKIRPFNKLSIEQITNKIDEIKNKSKTPKEIAQKILKQIETFKEIEYQEFTKLCDQDKYSDPDRSQELKKAFIPNSGMIFQSEFGFYRNLIEELRTISIRWKKLLKNKETPSDLAYKLIPPELKPKWSSLSFL